LLERLFEPILDLSAKAVEIRTKKGQKMTKEQIWALLEIYREMQIANTMIQYNNAFEQLHEFIEENCLKVGA
jgi:hypothetical protein